MGTLVGIGMKVGIVAHVIVVFGTARRIVEIEIEMCIKIGRLVRIVQHMGSGVGVVIAVQLIVHIEMQV